MVEMAQHEIVRPSPLLDDDGRLAQVGWARQPLLDCNLENAAFYRLRPLQRFRIKRWDYYGVTLPDLYFSATIADLGYAGQVFIYAVDFNAATYHEETITIPLGRGIDLPRNSDAGTSRFEGSRAALEFSSGGGRRAIHVEWADFAGRPLSARLSFTEPPESTAVVIPIGDRRFYYNRKINCMPAEGELSIGGEVRDVDPSTSSGNLDWGRGVWAYRSFWVWASASGFVDGIRRFGLNMGFGFGDTSEATENTVLIDGLIHKLGKVDFEYDPSNFMRPWTMTSNRVDLEFIPFLDRSATTHLLLIDSGVHQVFGRYAGTVTLDDGETVRINDLVGWAEEHHARW
jgi:hypothetical protein